MKPKSKASQAGSHLAGVDDKGAQGERAGRRGEESRVVLTGESVGKAQPPGTSALQPLPPPRGWADGPFGKH